ncbi:serine hydrolase [Phototrophicus methaneseepsis]|uniref:Serine hydrolase n=1 Tax=Phototrophicus methaneseepsis TaxID=2710758 RepID=A0A7S8IEE7_9CHLR|nr:serine hydrolase [Phototrophicus methaneseepsis]QPC82497.1 serine hydrolase [Phototrophicus methaneseepsis]
MSSSFLHSTPEQQGVPSKAILDFIEAAEASPNELHSFILMRHGSVIASGGWSPYAPDRPHMLFSLSKSFTSSAIGFAVTEGLLTVEDHLIDYFPDDLPATISDNLREMRIRHVLSMNTGHDVDTTGFFFERSDEDWIKAFFDVPVVHQPGTHFVYNTGATYMLSALIQKLTGQRLLDYLTPRLMQPLGIEGATWEVSPQGIDTGGFGLNVTTEDIAKLGQLYLQRGQWNGQQILPEVWIEEASSKHSDNGDDPLSDWAQGYGYQFWRCRHNAYRGDGAFGQYCIVMPEQDAVLAITSGVRDMQAVMNLVWAHLLPNMTDEMPLSPDSAASDQLRAKLASLAYAPPQGMTASPLMDRINHQAYTLSENDLGLQSLCFDFDGPDCVVTMDFLSEGKSFREHFSYWSGVQTFSAGLGKWVERAPALEDEEPGIAASLVCLDDQCLLLTLRIFTTPFVYVFACTFTGEQLHMDVDVNAAFGETTFSIIGQQT